MENKAVRILVALGAPASSVDVPTVILGLSDATWKDLEGGKAQDIDLRSLGIPCNILVMRGTDHDDIVRQLEECAGALNMPSGGLKDLSVPKPTTN